MGLLKPDMSAPFALYTTLMLASCSCRSAEWAKKDTLEAAQNSWKSAIENGYVESLNRGSQASEGACKLVIREANVAGEPKTDSEVGQFVAKAVFDRTCPDTGLEERCWVDGRAEAASGNPIWKMEDLRCETTTPGKTAAPVVGVRIKGVDEELKRECETELRVRGQNLEDDARRVHSPKRGENPFDPPKLYRVSERCAEYAAQKAKAERRRKNPFAPPE